jgi:hypothetical protein
MAGNGTLIAACQVASEFPWGGERARYLSTATWTEAEPSPTRPMLSPPWDSA